MDLSKELLSALLNVVVGSLSLMLPTAFGALIVMWSDVRSLKKAMNSAFEKIRALETKVCPKNVE